MDNKGLYDTDRTRKYLNTHQIPEIIESLLTSVAFYRPVDPFRVILQNLRKLKNGEIPGALIWDSFIEESDVPCEKIFKPSFIEQHIFDNPFYQQNHHKQMKHAITHHTVKIQRRYFDVLRLYQQKRKAEKAVAAQKTALADAHFGGKLIRRVFLRWVIRSRRYNANVSNAINLLIKTLSYSYVSRSFLRWKQFTRDIHWKNKFFQSQQQNQLKQEEGDEENDENYISKLQTNIALKIFRYLNLQSRVQCSMVCNSWHAMLQDCSLFTELDLSNSGYGEITDTLFLNILKRYRYFLYHVKLEGCRSLTSSALNQLAECKNLQDIDLADCRINVAVMQNIGLSCPFVTYLNLSNTGLDNTCFINIAKSFRSLRFLDVSYNEDLDETGFYCLVTSKPLKHLAHINLSGCCGVNGNCLSYVGQCCQLLTSLLLDNMPDLADECIAKMAATCSRLRVLSLLQAVRLTDRSLRYIAIALTQLEKVYLEGNKFVTDNGVSAVLGLKNLKHIHIVDCLKIYDNSLRPCSSLNALRVVNLTDCVRLSDSGIRSIVEGPSAHCLREITLSNCIRIGDQAISKIIANCPSLTDISVSYCENVTDVGVSVLAKHPSLYSIDLSGCNVTDHGAGILKMAEKLTYLSLSECNLLTDLGVERLSKIENLKYLDISYCSNITDYGMKMFIYERKSLVSLNVAGCKALTNTSLSIIASVCEYLKRLNLSELKQITDKGMRFIKMGCYHLSYLNVSYCPKLHYGCISKFIQQGCKVIHTMNNNG